MSSLILEKFLLFKISFITHVSLINHIYKNKMHFSLCDQMVEFVNLCPLGQDRKNEALKTKQSMAFWNGHLTSVIKRRSCLLFLVKHFICSSARQAGTSGDKKLPFLAGGGGGGGRGEILLKIYRLPFTCKGSIELFTIIKDRNVSVYLLEYFVAF